MHMPVDMLVLQPRPAKLGHNAMKHAIHASTAFMASEPNDVCGKLAQAVPGLAVVALADNHKDTAFPSG